MSLTRFVVLGNSGSPRPKIRWFRNGLEIGPEQSEFSVSEDGALIISAASASHSGDFTCVATNEAGSVERKTRLKVNGETAPSSLSSSLNKFLNLHLLTLFFFCFPPPVPPEIQYDAQPLNLTVTLRQPLTLGCDAFGIPSPTITWSKDGHPVCIH